MKILPIEYVNTRREYILFKNDVGVSTHARNGSVYEPHIFDYIKKNLNVQSTSIIDIGANFGFHTLEFASMVGEHGSIISFEPQKLVYYQLCGNIILNGFNNVTAHNIALSDCEDVLKMENPNYKSQNDINIGNSHLDAWTHVAHNEVTVKRLDDYHLSNVSVIKIDVQGYEPKVLAGSIETIKRNKPIIFIEVELDQLQIYKYSENNIFSFLKNLGYNFEAIGVVDYACTPS